MQQSAVAARYAQAFFDLTKNQGLAELHKEKDVMAAFKQALLDSKELSFIASNPVFPLEDKKNILKALLLKLNASKELSNFFFLLVDKKRLDIIPQIVEQYTVLLDEQESISRGTLTTAIAIDDSRKKEILEKLEKQTGRKLELDFKVDSSLLGGMILKLGDDTLDSSLAAQLNKLNLQIKRGGGE